MFTAELLEMLATAERAEVERHYIALHGLKGDELGTDKIPAFEEVAP